MPDLKEQLNERFVKAIRKSFTPCPLIGPKWLQEFPYGRPADFRFFGIRRLSKAIGHKPQRIIDIILRNLKIDDLPVEMKISQGYLIDLNRTDLTDEEIRIRHQRDTRNESDARPAREHDFRKNPDAQKTARS